MTLEVIKGPFETVPEWQPSHVVFVRTKRGLRQLGDPNVLGPFRDQAARWVLDKALGGRPQYWEIDVSELTHPEVRLELFGRGGALKFEILLSFNVRVLDAKAVLQRNIRNLDGYFTQALRKEITPLASRCNMAQAHCLQQQIDEHFGIGGVFANNIVELRHLTVQVQSAAEAAEKMKEVALAPVEIARIEATVHVTKQEMKAFQEVTGGMTIDALARVAIATSNPQLIGAYNNLRNLQVEEGQRNWERLRFLVENQLVEPHDLEKHLGNLGGGLAKLLQSCFGGAPASPKKIGNP